MLRGVGSVSKPPVHYCPSNQVIYFYTGNLFIHFSSINEKTIGNRVGINDKTRTTGKNMAYAVRSYIHIIAKNIFAAGGVGNSKAHMVIAILAVGMCWLGVGAGGAIAKFPRVAVAKELPPELNVTFRPMLLLLNDATGEGLVYNMSAEEVSEQVPLDI